MYKNQYELEMSKRELQEKINAKQKTMVRIANEHGLVHINTITKSQELDILINEYLSLTKRVKTTANA